MTQFNQFQNKIKFHEARFEAIAQTASDSIVISDEDSIIVFANKKTYEIFGYPEGSLIGSKLGILMPEKYRKGHRAGVQRFIATGNPTLIGHTIEIEGLRKDGAIFPLELSLSSWKEEQGHFFSGIIRDITERKKALEEKEEANRRLQHQQEELLVANEELKAAEEELRAINDGLEHRVEVRTRELAASEQKVKESEAQLRQITDTMPVLISYVGSDNTFKFVNKAYEVLFLRKREDIIGKPVWKIIGEKAYLNIKPQIERALKGESLNFDALQDYGQYGRRWKNISYVPDQVNGKVVGFFVLVEDISELKNIQLELEEKNQELERVNADLENFIYTASHDLKSPISNMEGLISLLKKSVFQKVEPKERNLLVMLDTSVQRLQKTIGDLVEITKVQKEVEEAAEEPLRFEELSREVKDDIYGIMQESNATIKENYEVKEIIYRKSGLRSILYNLLSNALKYRDPDRPLEVALSTFIQDGFVVLSVKDNGLGLNQKQQKKLFTLFKRMHQHVEGTGVGLFMIKRIVENNGGSIVVKSEEGKGTEFLVSLAKVTPF
jgi:PAS domain S-box-containing protein